MDILSPGGGGHQPERCGIQRLPRANYNRGHLQRNNRLDDFVGELANSSRSAIEAGATARSGAPLHRGKWATRDGVFFRIDLMFNGKVFSISNLVIIWLLQQSATGSVKGCHAPRSPRRFASFNPTLPTKSLASTTWSCVAGPMGSIVRVAVMGKHMSW